MSETLPLALMVAMAKNRCIGINNTLPWHLPEDLKHFKQTTTGKPVIMGRKTYDSIGRPLPKRTNIVITRNASWQTEGVEVAGSLASAIELARLSAQTTGAEEAVIMGGQQIYTEALSGDASKVTRLYITRVHADIDGDAFFPYFDESYWQLASKEDYYADPQNPYNYSFECWQKNAT